MAIKIVHEYDLSKEETEQWRRAMRSSHGFQHTAVIRILKNAKDYVELVKDGFPNETVVIIESARCDNWTGEPVHEFVL